MEVITKFKEVVNLYGALNSLGGKAFNVRVAYAISKNKQKVQKEIDAFNEALKPTEAFKTYEKERIALAKLHSKKDDTGNPVTKMTPVGELFVMENQLNYDKLLNELQEKHKEAVEEHKERLRQRDEMLEDTITLDLHGVKLSDLPETMSVSEMEAVALFIIEDETKKPELSVVRE